MLLKTPSLPINFDKKYKAAQIWTPFLFDPIFWEETLDIRHIRRSKILDCRRPPTAQTVILKNIAILLSLSVLYICSSTLKPTWFTIWVLSSLTTTIFLYIFCLQTRNGGLKISVWVDWFYLVSKLFSKYSADCLKTQSTASYIVRDTLPVVQKVISNLCGSNLYIILGCPAVDFRG